MLLFNRNSLVTFIGLLVLGSLLFVSCQKEQPIHPATEIVLEDQYVSSVGQSENRRDSSVHGCYIAQVGVDYLCDGTIEYLLLDDVTTSYKLCENRVKDAINWINSNPFFMCPILPFGMCVEYPCIDKEEDPGGN